MGTISISSKVSELLPQNRRQVGSALSSSIVPGPASASASSAMGSGLACRNVAGPRNAAKAGALGLAAWVEPGSAGTWISCKLEPNRWERCSLAEASAIAWLTALADCATCAQHTCAHYVLMPSVSFYPSMKRAEWNVRCRETLYVNGSATCHNICMQIKS